MDCTGLGMLEREQRAAADRGCRLEVLVGGGIVGRLIDLVGRDRLSVTRPPPVDPLSQARHG